jgi:hypothetical protein
MPAYLLTHFETWALASLLHIPVQPGSALSDWFGAGDLPESAELVGEGLATLEGNGYYFPGKAQLIQPELVKSLALAAVNPAEITVILRRNGHAALTRFAQAGKSVAQIGLDEEHLCLHPVSGLTGLAEKIIPDWFTVKKAEGRQVELPLSAFMLFQQACALADLSGAESNFAAQQFSKGKLLEQSNRLNGWVDILHAGWPGDAPAFDQQHLEVALRLLISKGYLQELAADKIEIGMTGQALATTFSDPDMCALIVSLKTRQGGFPKTGVFLSGGERLFLLEAKPGVFVIRQLANYEAGIAWARDLLIEGSLARFVDFIVAPEK